MYGRFAAGRDRRAVDTADAAAVQAAIATAVSHYGRIDLLFNDAGHRRLAAGAARDNRRELGGGWVTAVNGDGVLFAMKYASEAMLETGGGVVVSTSSMAGLIGQENISPTRSTRRAWSGSHVLPLSSTPHWDPRQRRGANCGGDTARAPVHRSRGRD